MTPREERVRRELVGQWIHKAGLDLRAAESLLEADPPILYPSCFHSQQAVEKYLKAFLVWHQVEFPKTHDLQEILELVESVNGDLARALGGVTALTAYAAEVRYPGESPEPDVAETKAALALARNARDAVVRALPLT